MPSAADDIVEMITARTSHAGGTLDLSESLDNLGLDSMEVVALIFDIEEKFNIQIPSTRIWTLRARPWLILFKRSIDLWPIK